jgi:hypothetical protein
MIFRQLAPNLPEILSFITVSQRRKVLNAGKYEAPSEGQAAKQQQSQAAQCAPVSFPNLQRVLLFRGYSSDHLKPLLVSS